MSYLYPPPSPNIPVVVHKDFGGLVSEYKAMTELYRRQNREVRLHECRSACTLALSLPNVCVYPHSVLRFHSAYHRDTKQVDPQISAELLSYYPPAVRERLGNYLTRHYRSLSGQELIDMGVRDCTRPPDTMIARARQVPATTVVAQASTGAAASQQADMNPVASIVGGVRSILGIGGAPEPVASMAPPRATLIASLSLGDAPSPPPRPRDVGEGASGEEAVLAQLPPEPPRRPDRAQVAARNDARTMRLPPLIIGAQPILPPQFTAYAALR